MLFLCLNQIDTGALPVVLPVMANPGLPKYLFPKSTLKIFSRIFEIILCIRIICLVFIVLKCMCGGTQPNHRSGTVKIFVQVLHLLVWQGQEPHKKDQPIRFL